MPYDVAQVIGIYILDITLLFENRWDATYY